MEVHVSEDRWRVVSPHGPGPFKGSRRLDRLPAGLLVAVLAGLAAACAPAPTPPLPGEGAAAPVPHEAASAAAAGSAVGAPAAAGPTAPPPAAPPLADLSALEQRLTGAGLKYAQLGELRPDYFDAAGKVYQLADGRDNLEVRVYPSTADAARAAGRVLPDGRGVYDSSGEIVAIQWNGTPHFYVNGPLLVVYIGAEPAVLDVLERVVSPQFAGAPRGNEP